MFVLGLQGSPRKKGNSHYLLTTFLTEAKKLGALTQIVDVPRRDIRPCLELIVCEKKGYCPIDDDMPRDIYGLIRKADLIVMASPVFFYAVTAQLKALIDRCQTLWARKYKLGLADPNSPWRRGMLLAVGATRGKELFTGLELTAKYFFDAVDADYAGSLTFPGIEGPKDLKQHADMPMIVTKAVKRLLSPFKNRQRILFTCLKNDGLSQIAAAMTQHKGGDFLEVNSAGSLPAEKIHPMVVDVMAEKGIDMAFRKPQGLDAIIANWTPQVVVSMDCWEACPYAASMRKIKWELPAYTDGDIDKLRTIRDKIEQRVTHLLTELR